MRKCTKKSQQGYTLITVLLLVIIVGVMSNSMLDMSEETLQVSSSIIHRDRVFQSIDSALLVAEQELKEKTKSRVFADANATEGVYSRGTRENQWWRKADVKGRKAVHQDLVLGVVEQPAFVTEEIGTYISDGGTGIVDLSTGSGAYSRASNGAREIVLYRLEAYGKGTFDYVQAAAESTVVLNR